MAIITRTAVAIAALLVAAPALGQAGQLTIGGTTYTKWLYGHQRTENGLQNFEDNGNNFGDQGQGTEVELLLDAKISRAVEVKSRIHSRFNQNYWTNFGGFGDQETSPLSNQYMKLRGVQVVLTPGYGWIDSATIGANDFGQFDPFVIGRIRYIDRDNASGLLFQGSALGRALKWDLTRISAPRLWAGPGYNTGSLTAQDATYGGQVRWTVSPLVDAGIIGSYTFDDEVNPEDTNDDDGRALLSRFRNGVAGVKVGVHGGPWADLRGALYTSYSKTYAGAGVNEFFGATSGFSPVPHGRHEDISWKIDYVAADPLGLGLSLSVQAFSIGAEYAAIMAARRESDVLLTEGHDGAFALPNAGNVRYAGYPGNFFGIGWGGWSGNAQQVATVNVDNAFTDFDEPLAETAVGWQGVTVNPVWQLAALELAGEYTFLTYDTNWQIWDDSSLGINESPFPVMEGQTGVLSYRSAYQPFQDKQTQLAAVRAKYTLGVGKGVDLFGKVKYIHEKDDRMTDTRYLPFQADGTTPNEYSPGNSTSALYSNPGTNEDFKPFTSVTDDDRKMDYWSFNLGAGYQLTDELYVSLAYAKYLVDLRDGNTAFQGYNSQQGWTGGQYDKNQVIVRGRYVLAGVEFGLEGQWNFGTFEPDYYQDGLTPQFATQAIADQFHVPVGSLGFAGRLPRDPVSTPVGWVRLDNRDFDEYRLKAFMKAQF